MACTAARRRISSDAPELLFSFDESFLDSTTKDRAKLLAEAGSGKTEEMKAQVQNKSRLFDDAGIFQN